MCKLFRYVWNNIKFLVVKYIYEESNSGDFKECKDFGGVFIKNCLVFFRELV